MLFTTVFRSFPAILAAAAATFALSAGAQNGQGYPASDINTRANPASTPEVVKDVQNSRAGRATVRGARKAGAATQRAGRKTARAIRHTGEKIGDKLPKGNAAGRNNVNTTPNVAP